MKKTFKLSLLTLCIALFTGVLLLAGVNYKPTASAAQSITPPDGYSVHNINSGYLNITSSGKYYVYGTGEQTENETLVDGNIQVEMILDNVNVRGSNSRFYGAIKVMGGATLTIRLVGSNRLIGCTRSPGIEVTEGNTVIITSYEGDGNTLGSLYTQTGPATFYNIGGPIGMGGAGIGSSGSFDASGPPKTLGNIIIKGGTITSVGAYGGAGIGGSFFSTTGSIRIEGGIVNARTVEYDAGKGGGAAIGGGIGGYVPKIEITGGTVNANVSNSGPDTMTGADIGAGYFSNNEDSTVNFGDIVISGGNVTCGGASIGGNDSIGFGRILDTGYTFTKKGSVTITGGTIIANKQISNLVKVTGGTVNGTATGEPTNGNTKVNLRTITVSGAFNGQEVSKITLSDGSTYGLKDVVITDTDKLYLYIPNNVKVTSLTVASKVYTNYTNGDILCYHDALSELKGVEIPGDDKKHNVVFACCGYHKGTENHEFDNSLATCITAEVCVDCGAEGKKYPEIHASDETYFKVNAENSDKHDEFYSCCNALKETHGHNYTGGSCNEPEVCVDCGANGKKYPEIHASDKVYYELNEGDKLKHDKYHECCDVYILTEGHNFDNGTCTLCKYICPHTNLSEESCNDCGVNGVSYIIYEWDTQISSLVSSVRSSTGFPQEVTSSTTEMANGWFIVRGEVTVDARIKVTGTVNLILENGSHLNVNGISVLEGNVFSVYARTENLAEMGKLTSNATAGAGIGGDQHNNIAKGTAGTLNFYGGIITASSASKGAGIGGGYATGENNSGTVNIYGGFITATGSDSSAGIGGSNDDHCGNVNIYGGTVYAYGGKYSAGIGSGSSGDSGPIVINGGTVYANSSYNYTIGAGHWGEESTLKDLNGNDVYLVNVTLLGVEEQTEIVSLGGLEYGYSNMVTLNTNQLYLYLPADKSISSLTTADGSVFSRTPGSNKNEVYLCAHKTSTDDVCDECHMFTGEITIEKNANGYYELATAEDYEQFLMILEGYCTKVPFDSKANAILVNDIDLTNVKAYPGYLSDVKFGGIFDGNGYTLTFDILGGLNAAPFGDIDGATIKNLVVKGNVYTSNQFAGGLVASVSGESLIQNVLVETVIETVVNGDGTHGGIAAIMETNAKLTLNGVGFIGEINGSSTNSCGGLIGWMNGDNSLTVINSFNFGKFSTGTKSCHLIARNYSASTNVVTVENFYYLNAYGEIPTSNEIQKVTNSQIVSGEVTYLLNAGVTDGTQAWYQTVGNSEISVKGETVYYVTCEDVNYYSNNGENHDSHEYQNGICVNCSTTTTPEVDENGVYQISNAGELFWFAKQVNENGNRDISGVLTADIDLNGMPWTPIGSTGENNNNFRGVFDGQNHTIKGLLVEGDRAGLGFFGEVRTGTVKNFTIYGEVVVNAEVDYVGGVIGSICGVNDETAPERNGAIIQNITSYVNVTAKAHGIGMIGGFVGYANHESLIENCAWFGTFDAGIYRVDSGAGGFIGKIQENSSEVTIRNCAAYGTIKTNYVKNSFNNKATIYIGGFLSFSNTNAQTTLENCLFAGKFECGENLTDEAFLGAFGTLQSVKAIKNCYYLGDDGLAAVHSDSPLNPQSENVEITSVTMEQLISGEVAYLLNGSSSDGDLIWGQDIGTESYPTLGGKTVYKVTACDGIGEAYSNVNEPMAHSDTVGDGDHACDECGEILGSCLDSENDGNHACDECGEIIGSCLDSENDGNHACDECGEILGSCLDSENDGNHACDECGEIIGSCLDSENDGNHACDECGEELTECKDSNEDYVCDECGAELEREGLSCGAITGITGGSAVGLGGITYLVLFLLKKKKGK